MKNFALATIAILGFTQISHAAMLDIAQTDTADNSIYALTLSGDEQFNGFGVNITPDGGGAFLNPGAGTPSDTATTEKTFLNAFLEAPVAFGGHGLSAAGKEVAAARVGGDFGLLGAYINATQGLWLGNVVLPKGASATYSIVLQDTGNEVARLEGQVGFVIPEPGTLMLGGMTLLGLVLRRRAA